MISVILPVHLGKYKGAARQPEKKLKRAINSVIEQSYNDWELIVIADGCETGASVAFEMLQEHNAGVYLLPKQRRWSGVPRNYGIRKAKGDIICYLDHDDCFGINHLQMIADGFSGDWVFFDDYTYKDGFKQRKCKLKKYCCGTSNIAHKKGVFWCENNKYGLDDWHFILKLMEYGEPKFIQAEYMVCHIPNKYDI